MDDYASEIHKIEPDESVRRISNKATVLFHDPRNKRTQCVQERRIGQQARYVHRSWQVNAWLAGAFRSTGQPCYCGRQHCSIEVRSANGNEVHCPMTFWGRLSLFAREEMLFLPHNRFTDAGDEWKAVKPYGYPIALHDISDSECVSEHAMRLYRHYECVATWSLDRLRETNQDLHERVCGAVRKKRADDTNRATGRRCK